MKKGFTLIELLAVIVILAIIAVIATPIVLNIINGVKKSSTEKTVELYLSTLDNSIGSALIENPKLQIKDGSYNINSNGNLCLNNECTDTITVDVDNTKPTGGFISYKDNRVVWYDMIIDGKNYPKEEYTDIKCFNTQNNSDGTISITGYSKQSDGYTPVCNSSDVKNLIFTSTINGKVVKSIEGFEISNEPHISVSKIVIPYGVTNIGVNAFYGVRASELILPQNLVTIDGSAFSDNNLKDITIPNSVTAIGEYAFSNNKLDSITIPENVTSIGAFAFKNNKITSIDYLAKDCTVGGNLFDQDSNSATVINSIKIGPEVTKISDRFLDHNSYAIFAVKKLDLSSSNKLKTIGEGSFASIGIEELLLPEGLLTIGENSFEGNNFTEVTIPSTVTSIGTYAFTQTPLKKMKINNIKGSISIFRQNSFQGDSVCWTYENTDAYATENNNPCIIWLKG